jgi:hypothetical protein
MKGRWPRLRDLPEEEQEPFREWLRGSTIPHLVGVADEDQDAYYPWDYIRWKGGFDNDD